MVSVILTMIAAKITACVTACVKVGVLETKETKERNCLFYVGISLQNEFISLFV